ncbi:MAG TPA: thioredoxin domain-containing protein, partial [Ktedonobacterales bacterium]|nr:thioredoxin domain-containing protein [Ktedonobacterales bacterium]
REKLYATRSQRTWPGRDDQVITAWNGLMLRAMAEAARALDRADYQQTAVATATFLTEHMLAGGRLQRTWRGGPPRNGSAGSLRDTATLDGYLEDYAAVANGLLSLYEDTGDVRWFSVARGLADDMLDRFWDDARNSFFDTAADHEVLIGRPRELTDNATPSGSSLAAEALLRLAAFTGEDRYRDTAVRVLLPLAAAMAEQPSAFGHFLSALDDLVGPLHEVAVVGASDDPAFQTLRHTLASRYLPRTVLAYAPPNDGFAAAVPLLADRGLVDGRPAAYVCEGFVCRQPVTTPDALLTHLA